MTCALRTPRSASERRACRTSSSWSQQWRGSAEHRFPQFTPLLQSIRPRYLLAGDLCRRIRASTVGSLWPSSASRISRATPCPMETLGPVSRLHSRRYDPAWAGHLWRAARSRRRRLDRLLTPIRVAGTTRTPPLLVAAWPITTMPAERVADAHAPRSRHLSSSTTTRPSSHVAPPLRLHASRPGLRT